MLGVIRYLKEVHQAKCSLFLTILMTVARMNYHRVMQALLPLTPKVNYENGTSCQSIENMHTHSNCSERAKEKRSCPNCSILFTT